MDATALEDFREAIAGPADKVDLFRGAMAIAAIGRRPPDADAVAAQLDSMARSVGASAGPEREQLELAQAVDHHLFSELGFHGAPDGTADPEASFLDRVIALRRGIPISLSLVYLEVARRVGLASRGVGFPGHFLVLVGAPEDGFYVDAFHGGQRVDRSELRARLAGSELGGAHPDSFLQPVTGRQILQRMLNNLRLAYRSGGRIEEWHDALDLALALEPWNSALLGERGMLRYRLGDLPSALNDLELYVGAQSTVSVGARRLLAELRTRLRGEEYR